MPGGTADAQGGQRGVQAPPEGGEDEERSGAVDSPKERWAWSAFQSSPDPNSLPMPPMMMGSMMGSVMSAQQPVDAVTGENNGPGADIVGNGGQRETAGQARQKDARGATSGGPPGLIPGPPGLTPDPSLVSAPVNAAATTPAGGKKPLPSNEDELRNFLNLGGGI